MTEANRNEQVKIMLTLCDQIQAAAEQVVVSSAEHAYEQAHLAEEIDAGYRHIARFLKQLGVSGERFAKAVREA